jgi:hypothetical protein
MIKNDFFLQGNGRIEYVMGNFYSSVRKPKSVAQIESNALKLVLGSSDLIHDIMDFLDSFKEITSIPQICRATSDSLFSYRFKNRDELTCDWVLFSVIARSYYSLFINKRHKFRIRHEQPELTRPDNYDRMIGIKFDSLKTSLNYVDKIHSSALTSCKKLKFDDFYLSQLSCVSEDFSFATESLELDIKPWIWNENLDLDSLCLDRMFPNVTKVILQGDGSASIFTGISAMLSRLPLLTFLDMTSSPVEASSFSNLPITLIELIIDLNGLNSNEPINLTRLVELKKLEVLSWCFTPRCIVLPCGLESFKMPYETWHENQSIPNSVTIFRSTNYTPFNQQYSNMRDAIFKSRIQSVDLKNFPWEFFQSLIPNLKNIKCSYWDAMIIIRILRINSSLHLTHMFFKLGLDHPDHPEYTIIICGENIDDILAEFMISNNYKSTWYHFPLKFIYIDSGLMNLPIPWAQHLSTIWRDVA